MKCKTLGYLKSFRMLVDIFYSMGLSATKALYLWNEITNIMLCYVFLSALRLILGDRIRCVYCEGDKCEVKETVENEVVDNSP